jgi:hypothetical protein
VIKTPIERFPWPLTDSVFRYSANVKPARTVRTTAAGAWGGSILDVDEHYAETVALRQSIFDAEPERCQILPHMEVAAWDTLLFCLTELAVTYPESMHLRRSGNTYHWQNDLLDLTADFEFGVESSLPVPPLRFAATQLQEDIVLLDQREGRLFADGVALSFSGTWSNTFVVGMGFGDIHGPVPRIHENGLVSRTEQFLMNLTPGEDYRRTSWVIAVSPRLDMSLEQFPTWGADTLRRITDDGAYGEARLRVEVQHSVRLPTSHAVLFLVKTHLCPLADIVTVPEWAAQLHAVMEELPPDLVAHKGFGEFREEILDWLRERVDSHTAAQVGKETAVVGHPA